MTQKEIDKFLSNTKVCVNGKSEEIQKKLFSLGYEWYCGYRNKVCFTEKPFIFIDGDKTKKLSYHNDINHFINSEKREITAEQILSLELTEFTYRPFKDKEECWQEMLKHKPFSWIADTTEYFLISSLSLNHVWLSEKIYCTFEVAFNSFTFADRTPFGIKEE